MKLWLCFKGLYIVQSLLDYWTQNDGYLKLGLTKIWSMLQFIDHIEILSFRIQLK